MVDLGPDVSSSNSTTGAGVADSWHSVASEIDEIKNAHDGDKAALAVELGISIASGVLDTVAFALDPFAKIISAGLGWLIEHIGFLKTILDEIAGNPAEIKNLADELHGIGQDLRNAASDLDSSLTAQVKQWQGPSYDAFQTEMAGHRTHVDDAGKAVDTAGYVVETTMALVSAVRNLIRDIITTILGDFIATMLTALAMAVFTFGASIPVGVATCVAEGTVQATSIGLKLAKVVAFAGRVASRLHQLANTTKGESQTATSSAHATPEPAPSTHEPNTSSVHDPEENTPAGGTPQTAPDEGAPNTHSSDPAEDSTPEAAPPAAPHSEDTPHSEDPSTPSPEDEPYQTWLAADSHFNGPGSTHEESVHSPDEGAPSATHGDDAPAGGHSDDDAPAGGHPDETAPAGTHSPDSAPPKPPAPKSKLSGQDVGWTKMHENWLKKGGFAEAQAKAKFFDNWVKKNAPGAYPYIKGLSDAKSSKNLVGWADKTGVSVDKQLTDVQSQAEQAWQQSDERHQFDQQQNQQQDPQDQQQGSQPEQAKA